jgi:iron(III) transport system permease protein
MLIAKSFTNRGGDWVGISNYASYLSNPARYVSLTNSLFVSSLTAIIVTTLAFGFAFALTRTNMPFKSFFKVVGFAPLLMPSVIKAISLVYFFGNQGIFKFLMFDNTIYGPIGIVMGSVLWTFPHVLVILIAAFSLSDARLYESAQVLKAGRWRIFRTVTLPGAFYGLISAVMVAFILVITDFGVPKVIGGNYNVLSTDIYKEVVGQQNFSMGAVVSVVLLMPAVAAFLIDRQVKKRQRNAMSSQFVPYVPKNDRWVDLAALAYCCLIAIATLGIVGMAQYASLVKFWPYNLSLTFDHYQFNVAGVGWENFFNSLKLALAVSVFGTTAALIGAYIIEKSKTAPYLRTIAGGFSMIPIAVPGLVLGLSHLMFINHPDNPLQVLYGGFTILIASTIIHFYTVSHLTATSALRQIDPAMEGVSLSLKVPLYKSFFRVTLPISIPVLLDISIYLFLASMTTVSGIIFLYGSETKVASVAAIHLDEMGESAAAAAMGMLIVYACVIVRLLHLGFGAWLIQRSQAWRVR